MGATNPKMRSKNRQFLFLHIFLQCMQDLTREGQRCPKRRVAQAAIRLATAVIKFRNKERNIRAPS